MKILIEDKIRMYDTDTARILFFGNIYRFMDNAFETFLEKESYNFDDLFDQNKYTFVIIHSESTYKSPLRVGDTISIEAYVSHIGKTSFTFKYIIKNKQTQTVTNIGKTTHVTLNTSTKEKITIPKELKSKLIKYQNNEPDE